MGKLIRVGDEIGHFSFGKGIVEDLNLEGYAKVSFSDSVRYVRLIDLSVNQKQCHEREEREAQEELEQRMNALMDKYKKPKHAELNKEKEELKDKANNQEKQKRMKLIQHLNELFRSNFLAVDDFFYSSCANCISENDFNQEKIKFIKTWMEENTQFNNNNKKSLLDAEQAMAIAAMDQHIQVVARAGSGKTSTLVNRAFFLMKHCKVLPTEILLLAFNRKAVLEIKKRLLLLLN
jgi:DNA helicase-4